MLPSTLWIICPIEQIVPPTKNALTQLSAVVLGGDAAFTISP